MKNYDEETYQHCLRTAKLASLIAEYSDLDAESLYQAALLHDIGKIFVDISIIKKPGALSEAERTIIDKHALNGYQYLMEQGIKPSVCSIVLFHHGKNKVPKHLQYLLIGLEREIQIMKSVDVFDALTHNRSYKKALEPEEAYSIMQMEKCYQEDIELIKKLKKEDRIC